ncbi:class I adenylate-forming enzyme family protein [Actinomadura rugatobispora]|uniref:Class I adenylate-forming enzyme family protein n=1 Tax=Actinomadura rugatobispora TaxID=1994 RepID=A0ABW0ZT44_9ACTN|nr:class I adenylate-forming enzyme family protein [Actinomadura rugatobispora]
MTDTLPDRSNPVTLRWTADRALSQDVRNTLCGPGGPFERTVEEVLGFPAEVFVQRLPHLPAVLIRAADRHPDAGYCVFDGPEPETLTYAEALSWAAAYAEVLRTDHGVGKGDRVAIASPNGKEYLLAIWATLSLGGIVAGLNGWWTPAELEHGIELTEPSLVLGSARPLERLAQTKAAEEGRLVPVALQDLHRAAAAVHDPAGRLPETDIHEDDPAAILFTSGTTSRPKGATLSHRNFVHFGMFGALGGTVALLGGGGRYRQIPGGVQRTSVCSNPFFHVSGVGPTLVGTPMSGSRLVFPAPGRWDAGRVLELTGRYKLTQWHGVPTHFWRMLTHPDFDEHGTDQVCVIGSGGSAFAPELLRLFEEKMPGVQITNGYGMTETTGGGTFLNGAGMDGHPASVGAAAPTMEVQVRGPDGEPLGEDQVGEVCIKGAGVFLGYWSDPEATAAAFADGRWYRTGDYGRIVDGVLYLESRMRDLIIRGGENIYPIEIEYRLVEHPGVADAAVIGVPDRILGQQVKAFVVPEPGAAPTEEELREWAGESLAAFKVPALIEFRDALPYNATGKVIKRRLEEEPGIS